MVKEGEREDSDHLPIEVKIKGPNLNTEAKQKREDEVMRLIRNVRSEEGVNHYHMNYEEWYSQK